MATGIDGSSTSVSLIERVQRRDSAAWHRLCLIYGPLVYRWARVVGLQHSDAADVGQEVFASVACRIDSFDHHRAGATFRGWLRTITRHKIGDYLKRRARNAQSVGGTTAIQFWNEIPEELSDAPAGHPAFDVEQALLHRTLDTLRAEFEPRTWEAFWRTTVDQHSTEEIAQQLGMSRKAVRQARYRVLRRLRGELGLAENEP